jgi:hydroxyacylglutathione hydrolase
LLVEQIWTDNSYRNFNYLIACPDTGDALAIDPLDHQKCLAAAKKRGWHITQVLNTHEHSDHTGGNQAMVAATGAKVLAHGGAMGKIGGVDRGLKAGDKVRIGKRVELECLDTPGHTMSHICLLAHVDKPAIFSGDTLFNAGTGHCRSTGRPDILYETFARQLATLPDDTMIYPGHDYIVNNLRFTLDREPDNARAKTLLGKVEAQDTNKALISTLGLEKEINAFFRLQNPSVIARLRERFPDLPEKPDAKTVFMKLRELRNDW